MNLVLYHGACSDGFASAFLFHLYFKTMGLEHELRAVNYKEPLPTGLDNIDVYIVDFCYSPQDTKTLAKTAKSITVLDHHLTAAENYGGYGIHVRNYGGCVVNLEICEEESGASLVLKYLRRFEHEKSQFEFLHNPRIEKLISAVRDYDLWYHEFDDTHIYHELLQIVPRTMEGWEKTFLKDSDEDFKNLLDVAGYYYDASKLLAEQFASQHQMINICGHKVPVVNSPHVFADRVCERLNQTHPFAISFVVNSQHLYCSLRSKRGYGVDVSEIARQFGGGGHATSSGFKIHPSNLPKLLSGKLTPKPCLAERILDNIIKFLEYIRFNCCK